MKPGRQASRFCYKGGIVPLIDEATIKVFAGAGGDGCVAFRREKYVPYGGPSGGNGGAGGSVYVEATHDRSSLLDFRYQPKYQGERGEHGLGSDCYGRAGEDKIIQVPVGTILYDDETGETIADLTTPGERICVAKGGRGGRGNMTYVTSTNRAPRTSTPGQPGEAKVLRLELRLIADVGLIGLPNAGKSTFLSTVSRARPKIADYPFTTLEPHLGVVYHSGQSFVVADLPGLIEGASQGAGLGHRFLKHVSRNRLLLHLVDISPEPEEIAENLKTIQGELDAYDPELRDREELIVFTKADCLTPEDLAAKLEALKDLGIEGLAISSQSGAGMTVLLDRLTQRILEIPKPSEAEDAGVAALGPA